MRPFSRLLDRILASVMLFGGVGHTLGTMLLIRNNPALQLWSFCASLFIFTLGTLNLIRSGRPFDRPIAWICLVGGIGWIVASLRFAQLLGNFLDPRPLMFLVVTIALCLFSLRDLRTA
jgi:uncharacterized membrane protein YfcA